jgi:transketolase
MTELSSKVISSPASWIQASDEVTDRILDEARLRARRIRTETIRLIEIAKSGHFTSVFSAAEILAVLYGGVMRLGADPKWPDRDRLILSKGHCAVGVYPLLADAGYFPAEWLDHYTRVGSPLGDHPDMRLVPGIDFSSGSLGHGLSVGVGMALSARMLRSDCKIWVLLGDQELNEGQIWEAAQAANQYGLGNLVAIVDRNTMGLDGTTEEVMSVEPLADRFTSFGWHVTEIDGHDIPGIYRTLLSLPRTATGRPQCVVAHTVKGKGVPYMERSRAWHLGYLAPDDAARTVAEIEN